MDALRLSWLCWISRLLPDGCAQSVRVVAEFELHAILADASIIALHMDGPILVLLTTLPVSAVHTVLFVRSTRYKQDGKHGKLRRYFKFMPISHSNDFGNQRSSGSN